MSGELEFAPAWWLPGPHLQAIGARLLRPPSGVRCERERLDLADGDVADLDWVAEVETNPSLQASFTRHGGHVGFVSGPPEAPVFGAEQTAAAFLAAHLR